MIISDTVQGSDEWLAERAGKVSASNFHLIFTATGKKTTGKTRETYKYKLAAERITGKVEDSFKSAAMERGNELEQEARLHFEIAHNAFVYQVGMVYLDQWKQISCSPDGLIGEDSGIEIKCPLAHTHARYLDKNVLPSAYKQQVQGCMWVTGRTTWTFMSYHPEMQPLVMTIDRDDEYIRELAEAVTSFNNQVTSLVSKLTLKSKNTDVDKCLVF